MNNKLIIIGWLGCKTAYLNILRREAIERWVLANNGEQPDEDRIDEFEFDDEFSVYDAWK